MSEGISRLQSGRGFNHFFSPMNNGNYRSACNKIEIPGGALVSEQDTTNRCKACQKSTRNGIKTTLFDYSR